MSNASHGSELSRSPNTVSYQVLARKWRPQSFSEMVGQAHVVQALSNAFDRQRLHHAYLLTGTRGVGKTTLARVIAKCLNCERGVAAEACGECPACTEIATGNFVDLIEMDAASRTGVDDIRSLLEDAEYRPASGRFKMYLLDEVHMLSTSSFNALLKTLEEPPEHVKFLLATTEPRKLPATVLSRCLQFHLKALPPELIVEHLRKVFAGEAVRCEDAALQVLARVANGSLRDALSIADQAIAFCGDDIGGDAVRDMLGIVGEEQAINLVEALASHDAQRLLDCMAEVADTSPDYADLLAEVLSLLHRVSVLQHVSGLPDWHVAHQERLQALAARMPAEDVQLFYQMGQLGCRDMAFAPQPRIGAEMALLRMLAFRPSGAPSHAAPVAAASAPDNAAASAPDAPVAAAPVTENEPRSIPDRPSAPSGGNAPMPASPAGNGSPAAEAPTVAPPDAAPEPAPKALANLSLEERMQVRADRADARLAEWQASDGVRLLCERMGGKIDMQSIRIGSGAMDR